MSLSKRTVASALLRLVGGEWLLAQILKRADEGHVSVSEARFLSLLARCAPTTRPIIEVGTLFGVSTRALAMGKPRDTPLVSVDNYSWNPLLLGRATHRRHTLRHWGQATERLNVQFLEKDREVFYSEYAGPRPYLVFLDAIHTYEATQRDIQWADKAGADLICSHDYDHQRWPGVTRAVDELGEVDCRVGLLAVQGRTSFGRAALSRALECL